MKIDNNRVQTTKMLKQESISSPATFKVEHDTDRHLKSQVKATKPGK